MKVVSLWSGGKDSCFACYKTISSGYKVVALLNFTNSGAKFSLSHDLSAKLILKQARSTGIPVLQKAMPKETYREEFKDLISTWKKKEGIEGIVFGDIYLQEHKEWIDKVCQELEVKAILPLWGRDTKELILEFVDSGFEAIVVTTKSNLLGKEWLGRKIDRKFIKDLRGLGRIDLCGEAGEYHTFVTAGPIFKKKIKILKTRKMQKDKYWFLDILEWRVV